MSEARGIARHIRGFIVFLICLLSFAVSAQAEGAFELHVLDVGQGQGILIDSDGHYMLLDGGGRESSSFVVSYLREHGVETLEYAAVSHFDEDHMSGVIGALNVFPCDTLLLPAYQGEGDLFRSLSVAALSSGCEISRPSAGYSFELGDALIETVGPVRENYSLENDRSLGFRIKYGNCSFLICGDSEAESEWDMAHSEIDISSDLLLVSHHGSSTSSTDVFLDAVAPTYAIISCGSNNSYGHPATETMNRLKSRGITMFRTDEQGTVIAFSDGDDIWFDHEPSDDWSSGIRSLTPEETEGAGDANNMVRSAAGAAMLAGEEEPRYVCNSNTYKFHYPDCKSVKQMKENNKIYTGKSREELIAEGYQPCGNCHP